jgi:hypothetical protein
MLDQHLIRFYRGGAFKEKLIIIKTMRKRMNSKLGDDFLASM